MQIRAYERNAKKHPEKQLEQLANIVREVGWRQPVIVNQRGIIVAGHGRWATWQQYRASHNLKEIWVMDDAGKTIMGGPETTPLNEDQEKLYRLADNKLNESEWDTGLVIEELSALQLANVDIKLTGFEEIPKLSLGDDDSDDGEENGGGSGKEVECPECGHKFIA